MSGCYSERFRTPHDYPQFVLPPAVLGFCCRLSVVEEDFRRRTRPACADARDRALERRNAVRLRLQRPTGVRPPDGTAEVESGMDCRPAERRADNTTPVRAQRR